MLAGLATAPVSGWVADCEASRRGCATFFDRQENRSGGSQIALYKPVPIGTISASSFRPQCFEQGMQRRAIFVTSPLKAEPVPRIHQAAGFEAEVAFNPDLVPPTRHIADRKIVLSFQRKSEREARWRSPPARGAILLDFPAGLIDSDIVISTSRGVHAKPSAEFAMMAMLIRCEASFLPEPRSSPRLSWQTAQSSENFGRWRGCDWPAWIDCAEWPSVMNDVPTVIPFLQIIRFSAVDGFEKSLEGEQ